MSPTFNYLQLGIATPGDAAGSNRLNQRAEHLIVRNRQHIEGRRVLDLACNDGRLMYPCLALNAKSVVGVEARATLIQRARSNMIRLRVADRAEFVHADVFDFLGQATPGSFDTINCFGFLYHTVRQVEFFRLCRRLQPEAIILDTSVARNYFWYGLRSFGKPPALFLAGFEDSREERNTTDSDGVVLWPTVSFLLGMLSRIGYEPRQIRYNSNNWLGMEDYRKGLRASAIGVRLP